MKLVQIYECLCDHTRLRILSLLGAGELCVCHIQEILGEPQVKVSKHLAYLRKRGLVAARRKANWMIYRLPSRQSAELSANLACLQDCAREDPVFRADGAKLRKLGARLASMGPSCCAAERRRAAPARR
jgi:ArsR family transcriptional regulator, arsenate/arsenite/antimonite-responsive transcriptional repressor